MPKSHIGKGNFTAGANMKKFFHIGPQTSCGSIFPLTWFFTRELCTCELLLINNYISSYTLPIFERFILFKLTLFSGQKNFQKGYIIDKLLLDRKIAQLLSCDKFWKDQGLANTTDLQKFALRSFTSFFGAERHFHAV